MVLLRETGRRQAWKGSAELWDSGQEGSSWVNVATEKGGEVNCRKARNLESWLRGNHGDGVLGPTWRKGGAEKQGRGPRVFQASGLEGPLPRILKCESVSHEESRPQAGPLIFLLPFSSGLRNPNRCIEC